MDRRISGLYAITEDTRDTALLSDHVAAAVRSGAHIVQYRNKTGSARLRYQQALALAGLVHAAGGLFIVNDSVELAAIAGADGVHLGRNDGGVEPARERLGEAALIGCSCYGELDRALAAARAGADYVAFGSFFESKTKPDAARAPIGLLRDARAALQIPIVAIGGITASNCMPLITAGADALAVSSAVFGADDIAAAVRALLDQFRHTEKIDSV